MITVAITPDNRDITNVWRTTDVSEDFAPTRIARRAIAIAKPLAVFSVLGTASGLVAGLSG